MANIMQLDRGITRQFIEIISKVVDEFRLTISKDGWNVATVDRANVAMLIINLPKENFLSYEFEGDYTSSIDGHPTGVMEEYVAVGVPIDKINGFIGDDKKLHFTLPDDKLPIKFTFTPAEGKYAGRYLLKLEQGMFSREILLLRDTDIRKGPKLPLKLYLDYGLRWDSIEFRRIIEKAVETGADYITLAFERKEAKFVSTATTLDDNERPWTATKSVLYWQALRNDPRNSGNSMFSLDYLNEIVSVIPPGSMWVHLGQDCPCRMELVLGKTGTVEYNQAPRVESE